MHQITKFFAAAAVAIVALNVQARQYCDGPLKRSAADFLPIGDGSQVKDAKTGLIWDRCIESQHWNGQTCLAKDPEEVNPGPRVNYEQALSLASSRFTKVEQWRLPTKAELLTLREPGCTNPSMNLAVFPTRPEWSSDGSFWSSTREASGYALVSAIGDSDSWAEPSEKNTYHVRLVRSEPITQTGKASKKR